MRRVRSHGTGPEKTVRAVLRHLGLAYRSQVKGLPGKPDFILVKEKAAIFVHGCFWHQHGCKRGLRLLTIELRL